MVCSDATKLCAIVALEIREAQTTRLTTKITVSRLNRLRIYKRRQLVSSNHPKSKRLIDAAVLAPAVPERAAPFSFFPKMTVNYPFALAAVSLTR